MNRMVKQTLICAQLLLLILLNTIGFTQEPNYQILSSTEQIAEQLNTATEEILLATNVFRSEDTAEAIREALVVRGVHVYLLVPEANANENAAYVAGLAHAGASVKLSEVGGSFLIIDRQLTIAGELIGSLTEDVEAPTILVDDANYAVQFIEGFIQGFEAAEPYVPLGE